MNKLYVIVRTDLKRSSPALQAGHAVAEFYKQHDSAGAMWDNQYLVYLQVPRLEMLKEWLYKSRTEYIQDPKNMSYDSPVIAEFREPDLNNELTAFSVYGLGEDFFDQLKLL